MRRTIEQEAMALEADEKRLEERRLKLEDRRKSAAEKALKSSGLFNLDGPRLATLADRMKTLGIEEIERRLAK